MTQHASARRDTRTNEPNMCASGRMFKCTVETKVPARSPADPAMVRNSSSSTPLDPNDRESCLRRVNSGEVLMEAGSNTDVQIPSRMCPNVPERPPGEG